VPWVNCPYAPTPPPLTPQLFLDFCEFFSQVAPHFLGQHYSPSNLAGVLCLSLWKFHGLVVPLWDKWTGSVGQRPVHCPPLSHLIWRPPCLSPVLSHPIWRPPCPRATCPTYCNLSQPVPLGCTTCSFPTPFCQIFVWVHHCHSTFRKSLSTELSRVSSTYYHVGEGQQQVNFRWQISMKAYSWFWSEPASSSSEPISDTLDMVQGFLIAHVLTRDVNVGWVSLVKFEADF